MAATFQIYNSKGGIAFRLLDGSESLCASAGTFDVVCDAERAIFAIKRNCAAASRVRLSSSGARTRIRIVAENGRVLAESAVVPASQAAHLSGRIIQLSKGAQVVDTRPNKRGGPGACVIG